MKKKFYMLIKCFVSTLITIFRFPFFFLMKKVSLSSLILQPILKNKKDILILGNGPSLKDTIQNVDLSSMNIDIVCVNEFALSDSFEKLKPRFYIFMDPVYWTKKLGDDNLDLIESNYTNISKKVDWPLILILPTAAKKWNHFMNLPNDNPNITIKYVNTWNINGFKKFKFKLYKMGIASPQIQNVLVMATFLCINAKYESIFIVGADHSWHQQIFVDENNRLFWKNSHFYDKSKVNLSPIYCNAEQTQIFKMHEIMAALSRMFEGYHILEEYSIYMRVKVYNASKESFIDAFERTKF